MIARAGVLAFGAVALAACNDSTAPLNVTPDQLQSMGESIATEIEGGITQLTAQDVMATNGGAPSFSRVPRSAAGMFRGMSMSRSAGAADVAQCGVASQNPPVDSDGDQIPDNFSLTFALPACHFADQTSTYDVTGVLRVSDPQPGTADMALTFGLENFKLAFNGTGGAGYVVRDGTGSVSVASTGLSQSQHWTEAAVVTGVASASASLNWTSTFAAAQGQSITAGHALPDGVYQPNGSVTFSQANRTATFSVERGGRRAGHVGLALLGGPRPRNGHEPAGQRLRRRDVFVLQCSDGGARQPVSWAQHERAQRCGLIQKLV